MPVRTPGRAEDAAELRLSAADLASTYLGAFSFERLAAAGRVEELAEGAIARAIGALQHGASSVVPRAVLVAVRVRTCKTAAEYRDALGAISEYGTWEPTDEERKRFQRYLPLDRMHAAFEGRNVVGGAGAFEYEVSVPGGSVACAGVTVVGVYPPHIRRGVLTAMMRAQLDDAHERGDEIAMLWASDERIYGRYGYGLASLVGEIELPRERAGFAAQDEVRGTISYVDLEKGRAVADPIWRHVFGERPGFFARSKDWWEERVLLDPPERRAGAGPKRLVTVEVDGGVDGYALYRHAPNWAEGLDAGRIVAIEVLARSLAAEQALWRYLASLEWASTVKARLLPLDTRLFWILAEPRRMRMRVGDGVWVRLLDVGAALSARSFSRIGPDRLPGGGRLLPVERRPLEARARRREEDARRRRSGLRRNGARLGLPRRLHVRAARARRQGGGAEARSGRAGGWDVPHRRPALVPRDLLARRERDELRCSLDADGIGVEHEVVVRR